VKRRTQLIVLATTLAGATGIWWALRASEPEVEPIFPDTDELWAQILSRFDPDQSGAIEPAEFELYHGPWSFSLAFEDYDSSGDGRIDAAELRQQLMDREPRPLVDKTIDRGKRDKNRREYFQPTERPGRVPGTPVPEGLADRSPRSDGPPNIILISMDTTRADHLSMYGYERPTSPLLDLFASHGTIFETAFSSANESAYSHAAMLSGRYASEIAAPDYMTYALPETAQLIPEILSLYGYESAAFIAGGHVGEDFGFNQGWDHFEDEVGFASFWHTTPKALAWLDERSGVKPWMVMVHGYDAHRAYVLPEPFPHMFTDGASSELVETIVSKGSWTERIYDGVFYKDFDGVSWAKHSSGVQILEPVVYERLRLLSERHSGTKLSPEEIDHIVAHYDAMIAYADVQLGLFLAAAEEAGHLENTLVIIHGDHGEDMMEHGFINHRTALTDSCVQVPLIMVGPGIPEGHRQQGLADSLDVVATILDAAQADPPADLRGQSLLPVLSGEASPRSAIFIEGVHEMIAVRTETHKLVYLGPDLVDPKYIEKLIEAPLKAPAFILYDLVRDPEEQHNLLAGADLSSVELAQDLRSQLVEWRNQLERGNYGMNPEDLDPEVRKNMQEGGYWEFEKTKTE
jgi:arylsulfatase A-like enzyme